MTAGQLFHAMEKTVCGETEGREHPVQIQPRLSPERALLRHGHWIEPYQMRKTVFQFCQPKIDGEGVLTFFGRNSDMYKINGENVSPQYVDHVLGQCPGVAAVETVGISHPKYGAVGIAFIDCGSRNVGEMLPELHIFCERHLARYQIPGYFVFSSSESWPKTKTGKIWKRKLRELAGKILLGEAKTSGEYQVEKWSS